MRKKPGILLVINDFNVGGAELFVYRLGIALQVDYSIFILDLFPDKGDSVFRQQFIDSGFILLNRFNELSNLKEKFFWKINALFSLIGRKGMYSILKNKYQQKKLLRNIKNGDVKIIHSHYFSADTFVRKFLLTKEMKWVMTMHGDYNQSVYSNMHNEKELFINTAKLNINTADALAYVADVNLDILKEFDLQPKKMKKIRLGLNQDLNKVNSNNFSDKKDFTFCMVARSNESKGWGLMIESFVLLNEKFPNTKLYCVGPIEGVLEDLSEKFSGHNKIQFTGYTSSPSSYILVSDVGMLPTYFEGESSPYSVIEYLSCNKPVIASDKGEIREMLSISGDIAGIVVQLKEDGRPSINDLMLAMQKLMQDQLFYDEKVNLTSLAFQKFRMENCKMEYIELYNKLLID